VPLEEELSGWPAPAMQSIVMPKAMIAAITTTSMMPMGPPIAAQL
jgi:hypothetical protein